MYQVIQRAQSFTAYGFTPDKVLSKHKTLEQAEKAFNKVLGRAVIVDKNGKTIGHKFI